MKQYTSVYNTPSGMPFFANKIGLGEDFICMQTGQYEYQCFVGDYEGGDGKLYILTRSGGGSSGYITGSRDVTGETFEISNDYYVYSNIGIGQAYALPSYSNSVSPLLAFLVVFEIVKLALGGLFKWKKRGNGV